MAAGLLSGAAARVSAGGALLFAIALAAPTALAAQDSAAPAVAPVGDAILVVERDGVEIGRERLVVSRPSGPDGRQGRTTLAVSSRYPAASAVTELSATVDLGAAGEPERFVLEGRTREGPVRVLAAAHGRRLVVRTLVAGTETARELPTTGAVVLLDDQLLGLLAAVTTRAGAEPVRLVGLHPRTGRRIDFTARRAGSRIELAGGLEGAIALGPDGLPDRIELPAARLGARRLAR